MLDIGVGMIGVIEVATLMASQSMQGVVWICSPTQDSVDSFFVLQSSLTTDAGSRNHAAVAGVPFTSWDGLELLLQLLW